MVDLNSYLPQYYEDIREAQAILGADTEQITVLNADIDDVLAQFFVDTATWGIADWERICGFPAVSNNSVWDAISKQNATFDTMEDKSWDWIDHAFVPNLDERRSAVKSKLRGTGTVTKGLITNVCDAYTGGTVEVNEIANEFRVQITFTDVTGVPSNIEALQSVLRDTMPAHLIVEYVYRYLHWSELDGYVWSWDTLDAKNYTWDEFSTAIQ